MGKITDFEIIVGTYEEFVVGYSYNSENKELTQSFASHSHNASVRSVAHSGHYLASGGADDRIVIYDLKSRKELCMLTHHNGTVNCLQFTDTHTHLMSGGSDGILAITRVGNWQLEKVWEKAHKGLAIIDIAIHPTNKLALTLGADCTLRTWNLIKGRQAYVINLNSKVKDPKSLQFIKWAPDGIRFVLCGGCHTDIWNIETGGIVQPVEHKNKVSYCLFYSNRLLVVGFENGYISMVNLDNLEEREEVEAHTTRIKSIDVCKKYLVTCSSNGEVKVWNKDKKKIKEVSTCNTGCRHTCLNAVLPVWIKKEENVDVIEDESNLIEIIADDSNCNAIVSTDEVPAKKKKKKSSIPFANEISPTNVNALDEKVLIKKEKKREHELLSTITVESPITQAPKKKRSKIKDI